VNCLVVQVSKVEDHGFNEEFSHLINYVEDDSDVFIVDANDHSQFWPASEFFFMTAVEQFTITKGSVNW